MHPTIVALRQETEAAKAILNQSSQNDPIVRVLLAEILHGQTMQNRVIGWLGMVGDRLDELGQQFAALEAQTRPAAVVDIEAPDTEDEQGEGV